MKNSIVLVMSMWAMSMNLMASKGNDHMNQNQDQAKAVYKILTQSQWAQFQADGFFQGNSADLNDGFIHLSKQDQLDRVIKKYYKGISPIYIIEFSQAEFLESLVWEAASNGDLYPHLYESRLEIEGVNLSRVQRLENISE